MLDLLNREFQELHLKSTVGDLFLYDIYVDITMIVKEAEYLFSNNPMLPGLILNHNKKFIGMISRKDFFETFSKPYRYELFSGRSLHFLFESYSNRQWLTIASTLEIVEAVQKALTRPKENFNDPILVMFENGALKILDIYQLILANSQIDLLAMKALKEANELKTEMLSIAAHDLKNPLNSAIGLTKTIKEEAGQLSDDSKEMLDLIELSLSNMLNLIIELLNSTVIEAGKYQMKLQYIDLAELMATISYQNQPIAEKKKQLLDFNYEKNDIFYIMGDAIKIRESIENIVSNAIKYSPVCSKIELGLILTEQIVQISVKDEGPGFTESDMKKLFGKFQRLSAQPTAGESSSGLGLYIAKQIVELHNGKIYVESSNGNGSTFFIELPSVDIEELQQVNF
jgi:signal transduction histidine kinase